MFHVCKTFEKFAHISHRNLTDLQFNVLLRAAWTLWKRLPPHHAGRHEISGPITNFVTSCFGPPAIYPGFMSTSGYWIGFIIGTRKVLKPVFLLLHLGY